MSFYAGCGGLDLGFVKAGNYKIIFANDIDEWACQTYKMNVGEIVCGNIADITFPLNADLVIGGPPCQSLSHAGKRLGLEDIRGKQFYYFINAVKLVQPKVFLIENVVGLLTHDNGKTYKTIHSLLEECGYVLYTQVLNCADYGIPQIRRRVFIVGVRNDIPRKFKFPKPTHNKKTYVSVKKAINDLEKSTTALNHEPMKHTQRLIERFKVIKQGKSLKDVPKEHMQRKRGKPNKISGKTFGQNNYRLIANKPAPTICASFQSNFIHYKLHRNLTAREAARLQTFPDDFEFQGKRTTMSWEKNLSQYQQIGNAVPPKMAQILAEHIKPLLK